MKLLFVTDVSIEEVIGGAERVLFEQCTRLAKKGHEVHVLTRRLPSHSTPLGDNRRGLRVALCRGSVERPFRFYDNPVQRSAAV